MKSESRMSIREMHESRHEPEALQKLTGVFWNVLLSMLAVSIVASIAYGAWEFIRPAGQDSESLVRSQANLSKTELQTLLQALQNRVVNFEAQQKSPTSVKDPF